MKKIIFPWKIITYGMLLLFFARCKDPYNPAVLASNNNYLVVEGYINGNGITSIKLSRTRNITSQDTAAHVNELNAIVVIEDQNNAAYPLTEAGNGIYTVTTFLNPANQYRLHIHTSGNKEYVSDYVPYKQSPPIDSMGWGFKNDDVQVYIDTHDPQNTTRFYRWSYTETWQVHSSFYSVLQYDVPSASLVDRPDQIYNCWPSENSTNILLASSAKLNLDVIHQAPLVLIPFHDSRISVLYSIFVTQYALDSSAYNYWQAIKSNTENVGSIFDPQPNQTKGNIHCVTDTSETVVGYIGAGSTTNIRFFIPNSAMPPNWNLYSNCTSIKVPSDSVEYYFHKMGYVPIDVAMPGIYTGSSSLCVDCRNSGGPNIKPAFWP
ncbi:MAG TPA: DUF4249 domain-containing protein [Ginsengibacter sp.]